MGFIEKETCDVCKEKPWEKVKGGLFICNDCPAQFTGFPSLISTVELKVGGKVTKTTKEEISELRRLRPIPKPGGGWNGGRMGENGKIAEKGLKS